MLSINKQNCQLLIAYDYKKLSSYLEKFWINKILSRKQADMWKRNILIKKTFQKSNINISLL